ncbi:hypothetical protein V6N12_062117 [Hibiscus sabdariffa]|uniref:Uncharacterized protein n=1 Tax=Hibiscus sabdariffa TaxID=183260 RepID=A0ABR2F801_9ROSI
MELTTNRIYVTHNVQFAPHIFPFATRHVLPMPRQHDYSLPIMSWKPAASLPAMPSQPNSSLHTMSDDSIATPVPLADPP